MQYAMLTFAAVLLAVDFALNKLYQKKAGTSHAAGFKFNALLGLLTAIVFFAINGFKMGFSTYSFIIASLMNCLAMCYNIIGFRVLKSGSMSLYTLFLMTGGMTVPYIWGLIFLDEPFSALRTVALVLFLAGVILSNFSSEKTNAKQIGMCMAVFVLNGFVSVLSKLHQIEAVYKCVNATEFVIIGGLFKFVLAGFLYLFAKKKDSDMVESDAAENELNKSVGKITIQIIAASAIVGGVSFLMQLLGAESLPATVLYPFLTGGSIVFSTLIGRIVFKEMLSKKLILSVVLCFAGTIMFI